MSCYVILYDFVTTYRAGLLTRRQLTSGPEFGVTVAEAPSLDGFHVVFGTILEGFEVRYYYVIC
jgi:cyclophilin family peptidyl-prolyl cis-trans isomerase